jgi:hypothetical protein
MAGTFAEHCVKAKAQESGDKRKQYNSKRHNASIRQKLNVVSKRNLIAKLPHKSI